MTQTVNKWFKIFNIKLWEWNETTRTDPKYIETNVTDGFAQRMIDRTDELNKDIDMFQSSSRMKVKEETA